MLTIELVAPDTSIKSSFLDAEIVYRPNNNPKNTEFPPILFNIRTYGKVAQISSNGEGRSIIAPINLFFMDLKEDEELTLYNYYREMREIIHKHIVQNNMTSDERSSVLDKMYKLTNKVLLGLKIPARLDQFAKSDNFTYPDLKHAGRENHHTEEMTFRESDYKQLTALCLFSKLMFPIWGDFIAALDQGNTSSNYREYFSQQIIDGILDGPVFSPIYKKFLVYLENAVKKGLTENDKHHKHISGGIESSFILSRAKMTTEIFTDIVGTTIIVKKMVLYECVERLKNGSLPDAMVYIDRVIKETIDANLNVLRGSVQELPRRPPPDRGTEDNTSLLDHASKISSTTADVPSFTCFCAEYEIDRMVEQAGIDKKMFEELKTYYERNPYPTITNPIMMSLVASFIGDRLGGSKTLWYLPFVLFNPFVVCVQLYLGMHKLYDLVPFVTCLKDTDERFPDTDTLSATRIKGSLRDSPNYMACIDLYQGYSEKQIFSARRGRGIRKSEETQRIDFENQVSRLVDWLTDENRIVNTPPFFWHHFTGEDGPALRRPVPLRDNVTDQLCQYYLMFHKGDRPF